MLYEISICVLAFNVYSTAGFQDCVDVKGQVISHGHLFVPAPDNCRLCLCDNGQAKVCKVFFCSHPKDCRSFTVGSTCCEYICLDDAGDGGAAHAVAGVAGAFGLLGILALLYRLRELMRRRRDDERSLDSIGFISDGLYAGARAGAWKPAPPPRGEAPPPYEEAVALSRAETMRISETSFHRSFPNVSAAGHSCAPPEMALGAGCCPPPLSDPLAAHLMPPPHVPLLSSLRLAPGARFGPPAAMHRTIPRLAGGADAAPADAALDRAHAEVRRSFHRPPDARRDTGRSMPRNLNLASDEPRPHLGEPKRPRRPNLALDLELKMMGTKLMEEVKRPRSVTAPAVAAARGQTPAVAAARGQTPAVEAARGQTPAVEAARGQTSAVEAARGQTPAVEAARGQIPDAAREAVRCAGGEAARCAGGEPARARAPPKLPEPPPQPRSTLPLTVDKPSCVCYASGEGGEGGTETEDADDYRSECENCKSTGASKWVKEEDREAWAARTQTLTRQASPPAAPPPAASTLPVRHSRPEVSPPSNWENWFSAIPDSDTESEDE